MFVMLELVHGGSNITRHIYMDIFFGVIPLMFSFPIDQKIEIITYCVDNMVGIISTVCFYSKIVNSKGENSEARLMFTWSVRFAYRVKSNGGEDFD